MTQTLSGLPFFGGGGPAIILLEGVDKCGKTTDAEDLAVALDHLDAPCEVVHFGVPTDNPFDLYRTALNVAWGRSKDGLSTVIDRLHWSNYAYQRVYRGRSGDATAMRATQHSRLDSMLADFGVLTILKERPDAAQAMDAEDYGKPEDAEQLTKLFRDCWLSCDAPTLRFEFPDRASQSRVVTIAQGLNRAARDRAAVTHTRMEVSAR